MSLFWHQYKALLYRNLLLKKRNKKQFSQELFMPIYFVCILAMTKALIPLRVSQEQPISSTYNILYKGFTVPPNVTIHVSPDNSRTRNIMTNVASLMNLSYNVYPSSDDAYTAYEKSIHKSSLGVIFNYSNPNSFAIRAAYSDIANTDWTGIILDKGKSCRSNMDSEELPRQQCGSTSYLYTGFSALQLAISTAILQIDTNASDLSLPDISIQRMPKRPYTTDSSYIQIISSIYFVIAFSPLISILTVSLVTEKEKKIKEGMRMMGMRDSAFWCAWTTIYTLEIIFIVTVMCLIAFAAAFFNRDSNYFIFFLMLLFYGLSIINIAFMISPFFEKATTAGGVASMGSIIISLLYLSVSLTRSYNSEGYTYSIPVYGRWLLCLLSPVSFSLAIDQALFLDIWKGGLSFASLQEGEFPLYAPILMLVIDFLLYGFLAIYFDNVIPGEYGRRRSPLFCFQASYWFNRRSASVSSTNHTYRMRMTDSTQVDVEPIPEEFIGKEGIEISDLRKVYKKDKEDFAAVDGISLTIYEGQITGLLGHNGAGKTTLINMLVGLAPVTSGQAWIKGMNITDTNSMDVIRSKTGVCPQRDILLDDITAKEHLVIFAVFKGIPKAQVANAVDEALESVDLTDKADTLSKDLSGGQKRKLSVALALIGDPKILFLDEPTAGMDPFSRRHLWSLLQSKKQGRIILLTTHFMDEADILADRKVIISKGQLRCCGSSLFLKNRFGIGYHLNMVVEPGCDVSAVTEFLKQFADKMKFVRLHGNDLSYTLPFQNVSSFAALFLELERQNGSARKAESLGIHSYGVSMTTLEEVFLKLAEDDTILEKTESIVPLKPSKENVSPSHGAENINNSPVNKMPKSDILTGAQLRNQRFYAMLRLAFLMTMTNVASFIFSLVLPVVFLVIGIVLSKLVTITNDALKPKDLNLNLALGRYIRFVDVKESMGPPLLFDDSSNDTFVGYMYKAMSNFIKITQFDDGTDLTNIGQHFVGVNVSELNPVSSTDYSLNFTIIYNFTAAHVIPATMNLMMNNLAGTIKRGPPSLIEVYSLPWNSSDAQGFGFNNNMFSSTILIAMAFILIAPGMALFVVKDKETKSRTLLRVSGITVNLYWFSLFVYSCCLYLIPVILTFIVVLAAQLNSYKTWFSVFTLILSLLLYMPTSILVAFNLTFLFKNFQASSSIMPNIFVFGGLIPYLAVSLVDMISNETIASYLHIAFCFLDPIYIIFGAVYYIDKVYRIASINNLTLTFSDYYSGDIGINILFGMLACIFHTIWLAFLLRILEVKTTGGNLKDVCSRQSEDSDPSRVVAIDNCDVIEGEDVDVRNEREKVTTWINSGNKEAAVMINKLRKEFKSKVAVKNATFGVAKGEVFGLLGPNGAGKTTIMNMIMAEIGPTSGSVHIAGHNVQSSLSNAFQALGVCPQHDALYDLITLRQHLMTYALIEGVAKADIEAKVNYFIESMNLQEHANKKVKELSGGTKRKLSFAISMMGEPKIVLMDEPSTGMDPQSKRFFWDTISGSFSGHDRGAILTTHSMEEADALCSRVAIMVNGQIQCIGSTQHLKDTHGSGYLLEVKIKSTTIQQTSTFDDFVTSEFDGALCTERFGDRVMYKIPQTSVASLGMAFAVLEGAKEAHNITEYSFSQSTLEQVFLDFAKAQLDEGEKMLDTKSDGSVDVTNETTHNITTSHETYRPIVV